ncbi:LPS export ABC transporter permease LptG [Acetobacteraceae bacterium H6797]|nr:LPS export ABC transporter permease LptG [Acetobacteraceae bacterium H6797]
MIPMTFTAYVSRRFVQMCVLMLLALTFLVALFDFIELLRRAANRPDASFGIVVMIAGLRLPFVALQILPFSILLGGIVAFWRLTRSSELIVARAAGISAWGFLAGPLMVAAILGAIGTTALSPLSSAMLARAERMDGQYLRSNAGVTAIAGGRLWLRQADREFDPQGVAIFSGRPAPNRRGTIFSLTDVSIWRISGNDRAIQRIEAPSATLGHGRWELKDAVTFNADRRVSPAEDISFPTDLTSERIETSFASPDTISFWALPDFIALLEASGFSAVRHRLEYQSLLSLPVLAVAMGLLAAGCSMRASRRGGVGKMIAAGVGAGFALFVLDKVSAEFGQAGTLPVTLAAWVPSIAGLLLALALLLHLEDG